MPGLRQRQKIARDRRILEGGAELFRADGYDGATMEAIAGHAGVSPATIYNYYKNKGDLLVAIVAMEVHEVLAAGERLVSNPPSDLRLAIDGLARLYLEHSLTYLSKEMWRHAMAISLQQPGSPSGSAYSALDEKLSDQVCRLLRRLQADGLVRRDVDVTAVAELLFNTIDRMFVTFLKSESMRLSAVKRRISKQCHALLDEIGRAPKTLAKALPRVRAAKPVAKVRVPQRRSSLPN